MVLSIFHRTFVPFKQGRLEQNYKFSAKGVFLLYFETNWNSCTYKNGGETKEKLHYKIWNKHDKTLKIGPKGTFTFLKTKQNWLMGNQSLQVVLKLGTQRVHILF